MFKNALCVDCRCLLVYVHLNICSGCGRFSCICNLCPDCSSNPCICGSNGGNGNEDNLGGGNSGGGYGVGGGNGSDNGNLGTEPLSCKNLEEVLRYIPPRLKAMGIDLSGIIIVEADVCDNFATIDHSNKSI